jgi:L-rhamnose mutarotase
MERVAFKMKLFEGKADEYKSRHSAIWPELAALLKESGISNYSIFLDEESNWLFGAFVVGDKSALDNLPGNPVMKKWWAYMADLMESNPDNTPVSTPLKEMFFLL